MKNLKKNFQNWLKSLVGQNTQSSNVHAQMVTVGDQLDTQILKNSEQSNIVQHKLEFIKSISKLRLLDFISCCIDNDFSSLIINGEIQDSKQLNQCWINILSQYHEARKDERTIDHINLLWELQKLRERAQVINLLTNTIGFFYSKTLINAIKNYDSEFEQFEFSEETIENDLILISNIEINNEIEYRNLLEQLEEFEKSIGIKDKEGNKIEAIKANEQIFYDYVMSYNEIFKTSHSVTNLNTMEYARMCYRHDEYVKNQKIGLKEVKE